MASSGRPEAAAFSRAQMDALLGLARVLQRSAGIEDALAAWEAALFRFWMK